MGAVLGKHRFGNMLSNWSGVAKQATSRDLHDDSSLDEWNEKSDVALHDAVPFGVRNDRNDPANLQLENHLIAVLGEKVNRPFNQQVAAVVDRERNTST